MGKICISKDTYTNAKGTVYKIPTCAPNKFNEVYPYVMFGVFFTSWSASALPSLIHGLYIAVLPTLWLLFLPIIFFDFKNFIPSEIKLSEGDALVKMGTCSIVPVIKLMNVRFRYATEEDFMKCKWPQWQCRFHSMGMSWNRDKSYVEETTELVEDEYICVEGEHQYLCFTIRNRSIIVPSFAAIGQLQVQS